jgi:hypothetical protein
MNNFRCRPFAYKFFGSILEVVTKQTPEEKSSVMNFPKSIASPMSSTKNSSKHNTLYLGLFDQPIYEAHYGDNS